jgi:hypothetical protein
MNEVEEDTFLSQATDEAKAAYYRRQADQGNTSEPSHNNEVGRGLVLGRGVAYSVCFWLRISDCAMW